MNNYSVFQTVFYLITSVPCLSFWFTYLLILYDIITSKNVLINSIFKEKEMYTAKTSRETKTRRKK